MRKQHKLALDAGLSRLGLSEMSSHPLQQLPASAPAAAAAPLQLLLSHSLLPE